MSKKLRSIILMLVMVLALALVGCGGSDDGDESGATEGTGETDSGAETSGDTFKLGAFLQLSGDSSAFGNEARRAIELAIKHINAEGGLNGEQIEFVPYDTQGSPEEALKAATRLADTDEVDAVIGSVNSGEVVAAAGYLNENEILTFGLGTAASWMENDWPYVFRAALNNSYVVPLTVDIMEELEHSKVAVFYGQDDASIATAQAFFDEVEGRGMEITTKESFDKGDVDFSAQAANMINSGADTVYLSVMGEVGPIIVKQLRQQGYNGIILYKESFMVNQVEIAGEANSNYIAFANPYVTYASSEECDIPIVADFIKKHEEEYGEANMTDSAYRGWDTMMVLWEASKIAGSNETEALVEAIHTISGIEGLGGTIDYTSGNREAYSTFNKFILVEGKNILWDEWIESGGYEAYLEDTGREN